MAIQSRIGPRYPARHRSGAAILAALAAVGVGTALASEAPLRPGQTGRPQMIAVGNAAASADQALYLVRSTLLSLDDANRSGNYTVLRDLAAPGFQKAHSAADLALIFSELRRSGIALTPVAIAQPHLVAEPAIDAAHVLQLTGILPTAPLQLAFDMRFQSVEGAWRLAALSVGAQPRSQIPQAAPKEAAPVAISPRPMRR
jgi:hypothetical protein